MITLFHPDTIPTLFLIYQLCSEHLLPVVRFHNLYCNCFRNSINWRRSQGSAAPHLQLQIEENLFHSTSLIRVTYLTLCLPLPFFFFAMTCYLWIPYFVDFCRWYKFSFGIINGLYLITISSLNDTSSPGVKTLSSQFW